MNVLNAGPLQPLPGQASVCTELGVACLILPPTKQATSGLHSSRGRPTCRWRGDLEDPRGDEAVTEAAESGHAHPALRCPEGKGAFQIYIAMLAGLSL